MKNKIRSIEEILFIELNIKEIEFISLDSDILTKQIKPNFKNLGPKFGKDMKLIASILNDFSLKDIIDFEKRGQFIINKDIIIDLSDVEISSVDIPGWKVMSQDGITVALDVNISNNLKEEGMARELVNRIQNIRKEKDFEVTDKIDILVEKNEVLKNAIDSNLAYICSETLADTLKIVDEISSEKININLVDDISVNIEIKKI